MAPLICNRWTRRALRPVRWFLSVGEVGPAQSIKAALRGAWYAAAPDTQFDRLVTRYRARYGKTPYRLASLGYDSVLLAVRSAKNWPIGRAFPAKGLVDKDGFAGVDGSFRFVHEGVAERLLEVRQVTATGTTVVSPAGTVF